MYGQGEEGTRPCGAEKQSSVEELRKVGIAGEGDLTLQVKAIKLQTPVRMEKKMVYFLKISVETGSARARHGLLDTCSYKNGR